MEADAVVGAGAGAGASTINKVSAIGEAVAGAGAGAGAGTAQRYIFNRIFFRGRSSSIPYSCFVRTTSSFKITYSNKHISNAIYLF